jgi:endonuclease YncB( thermonuclease family)
VYDVYDGDTVKFIADLGGAVVKMSLRLRGIDTPELRGAAIYEKVAGELARERLKQLIGFKGRSVLVRVVIYQWDKYGGRVVGDIIPRGERSGGNVTDILISEGYGRKYGGEKKQPWTMDDMIGPYSHLNKL